MATNKNNTLIVDVKPTHWGKLQFFNNDGRLLDDDNGREVSDLYVAMEAFDHDYNDIAFRVLSLGNSGDPIIFKIVTMIEGNFLLYTSDTRMVNIGYLTHIKTDDLYFAMKGLSYCYKDMGEFIFQIEQTDTRVVIR